MKISQVMLTKGFGGGERLFVDLCMALTSDGHQVQAVCHPAFEGIPQLRKERGITVSFLRVKWDWSPWARLRLARILGQFSPQVIHSHLSRASAVAGDVGTRLGIPVVANVHNYINLKYFRKISHFCPGTEDQRQYLMRQGIAATAISVVPHFSLLPVVADKGLAPAGDSPPVLVTVGRFVRKKGYHLLLEAMKHLVDGGVGLRLILGGDGPEKANLHRQAAALGLLDCVSFPGWIDNVGEFLLQGDYFVLPSLDEPFGIVVLEAMASGRCILASMSKGPLEILDASTAWMFPVNDAAALAEAIRQAVSQPLVSAEKVKKSQERYKERYAAGKVLPLYVALYHRLARRS